MEQRQLFLRDVLTVLFKRKFLIAIFAIVVIAAVFVGNQVWPSTYESSAKIRILRGRETSQLQPTAVQTTGGMTLVQMGREDINSEIEVILSNDVLKTVVQESGLAGSTGLRRIILSIQQTLGLKGPGDAEQEAIEDLRERIEVTAIKDSFVLEIVVQSGSAQQAQDVCANIIDAYTAKHAEIFSTTESKNFFDTEITRVERELSNAQAALNAYRNQNNVISVEAEKELLLEQYREAKKLLVQLEQTEGVVSSTATEEGLEDQTIIGALSSQTESPVVTELQLKLLELVLRRNNISRSLGPKHPEIVAVTEEIRSAHLRLVDAIETTKQVTEARVTEIENRITALNGTEAELELLEGKVAVLKDTLEYYSTKAEESLVAINMRSQQLSSISIISKPQVPADPVSPNKLLNLVIGILAGVIGGVGLAFFLEYLDHGLKTPEDIEYFLNVPCLASFFKDSKLTLNQNEVERLAAVLDSGASESKSKLIQVASAVPGEGSQRVARALAEGYAENPTGHVLLIDLASETQVGFADVVEGVAPIENAISEQGSVATLGGGKRNDCPVYLWSSDRMEEVIGALRGRYERIIFHTLPVLQSHDAINLARFADGAVIAIQADNTRREVVQRAVSGITNAAGRVIGTVLLDRKQVIPGVVYRRI